VKTGRVCLIGPGAPSSNPRLVKEGDALAAAGYQVRVVCGMTHALLDGADDDLLARRSWSVTRVPLGTKIQRVPRVARKRIAARLAWGGLLRTPATIAWAESELSGRLAQAVAAEPADLYLGHYLPGLFAAWSAAQKHRAAYGFDAEDSHVDEFPDTSAFRGRREAREMFERQILAGAAHLTTSSPLIADAYERRYGRRPLVILNVFPLADAPPGPCSTPYLNRNGQPTLYWFSQTIGPGRGLEPVIAAMGRMKLPVVLHLRGISAAGYRERLTDHATTHGVADRVVWHPPAEPGEMVRLSAGYDLGLALELTEPPNRAICLTNKAFTYLLAGVPVVLSRTPAQEGLAVQLGGSALLIDLSNPDGIAAQFTAALEDRESQHARRNGAWKLGRNRFNWDVEQRQFLAGVEEALATGKPVPSTL